MKNLLISFLIAGISYGGWIIFRRLRRRDNTGIQDLEEVAKIKSQKIHGKHMRYRKLREFAGVFLLVGLSMFIVGGISEQFNLALVGWLLWGLGGSVAMIVNGLEAILVDAALPGLIISSTRNVVHGEKARLFGRLRIIGGLLIIVIVLIATISIYSSMAN